MHLAQVVKSPQWGRAREFSGGGDGSRRRRSDTVCDTVWAGAVAAAAACEGIDEGGRIASSTSIPEAEVELGTGEKVTCKPGIPDGGATTLGHAFVSWSSEAQRLQRGCAFRSGIFALLA